MLGKQAGLSYVFLTIVFTFYSQVIVKWRVSVAGPLPEDLVGKSQYVASLLANPWVVSAIISTFAAGVSWMLALTKLDLSFAFPFVSVNFILIMAASALLFGEPLGPSKIFGTALIVAGIIALARP